ncbi:S-adenosyl-L-methionine-dependent methyltransferase [Hypoxylon sp. NC1633]|nr:S-adenosyl-L-methionine-dependent methyltransferase [Hypoxylon sp. NC1633]
MSSPPNPGVLTDEAPQNIIEVVSLDRLSSSWTLSSLLLVSSTQSLSSSILKYREENGRRYHAYKAGQYWAPNDDIQQGAEDLSHTMYLEILDGKLHRAPISDDPQHVLDVGCGTFADEYPSAEVIGIDLSPIQPATVPSNCRFVVDDINEQWQYPDDKFDLIHICAMAGSVPDWVVFHKIALRHLKPGGFVKQVELLGQAMSDNGTLPQDNGNTFAAGEVACESIDAAGFIHIHEEKIKVPIGPWAKDKKLKEWGYWNLCFLSDGLEGFALRGMTTVLGWPIEKVQLYLAQLRKELKDPIIHSYLYLHVVYGQKPEV